MRTIVFYALLFTLFLIASIYSEKLDVINEVNMIYICQTEHELEKILALQKSNPAAYKKITKNGTITPAHAAMTRANTFLRNDGLQCNEERKLVLKVAAGNTKGARESKKILDGEALRIYCPTTIKKHAHPCH